MKTLSRQCISTLQVVKPELIFFAANIVYQINFQHLVSSNERYKINDLSTICFILFTVLVWFALYVFDYRDITDEICYIWKLVIRHAINLKTDRFAHHLYYTVLYYISFMSLRIVLKANLAVILHDSYSPKFVSLWARNDGDPLPAGLERQMYAICKCYPRRRVIWNLLVVVQRQA